jgi:hypothetical protein
MVVLDLTVVNIALPSAQRALHSRSAARSARRCSTRSRSARTTTYLATHHAGAALIAHATIHGYSVALWTSAGIFAVGAVVCGLLLRGGAPRPVSSAGSAPSREGGKSTGQTRVRV